MSIIVTGATGQLGRVVVENLLERDVPAPQIVATGRDIAKLSDLAALGVDARHADYDDPGSLDSAFAGGDRLLLVSGSDAGRRAEQHQAAIDAAMRAGIGYIAYTSIANADSSSIILAQEHLATEIALANSGLDYALLRNSWYLENYTDQLQTFVEFGVAGAAGDGRVSAATRRDFAEAAAAVLVSPEAGGATFELGGVAFTLTELAAEISRASGRPVAYTNLDEAAYADLLVQAGLPEGYAAILADADRGLARGDLEVDSTTLARLIGRQPTSMASAVEAAFGSPATG